MKKILSLVLGLSLFLTACGSVDTTLDNGLQIKDVKVGSGPEVEEGDTIVVHYEGSLEDGTVFDSSYERDPATFPIGLDYLIEGWEVGILGMQAGGVRELVIPADLGYGDLGVQSAGIPPEATLYFTIELLEIK